MSDSQGPSIFELLLARIASKLDEVELPYMVIGGQAVLLYGEPRLTAAIDITLGATVDQLTKVLEAAEAIGLRPLVDPEPFVSETMVLPCEEPDSGIRVDFIFSNSPYERQAIERGRPVSFEAIPVRFATLEDVIIHKLIAGRPRDLEDVRSMLIKNPGLDTAYVRGWLDQFTEALDEPFRARFDDLLREVR